MILVCIFALFLVGCAQSDSQSGDYAVVIDGIGVPKSHFNFYLNRAHDAFLIHPEMVTSNDPNAQAIEISLDAIIEMHVVTRRAADFGMSIADVDADDVQAHLDFFRTILAGSGDTDPIADMGFTDDEFREFLSLAALHGLMAQEIDELDGEKVENWIAESDIEIKIP